MTKIAGGRIPFSLATATRFAKVARTERCPARVPCSMTAAGVVALIPAAMRAALTSGKVLTPM
jgi:ABC-type uncharacterized transport system permease subunit